MTVAHGQARIAKVRKGRKLEDGLIWVEVYLPFDPVAFSEFQRLAVKLGSGRKAAESDPHLAERALTPIDSHGEAMLSEDVRKLAHRFLVKSRKHDVMHDERPRDGITLVESFLNGPEVDSPNFWPGAWVVVMRVAKGSEAWARIESGELDAVSFQAYVKKQPIVAIVEGESDES